MNAAVEPLEPAGTPAECVNWLAREDLTRLALKAYEMARGDCTPRPGESFMVDGDTYAGRSTFRDCLLDNLALLVDRHGLEVGCWPSFNGMDRLEMLEVDFRQRLVEAAQAAEGVDV